jgi:hypothetical protein
MSGNEWADRFANTIKFGKFALLLLLLTGSFVNGHKSYIQANPRKFVWDSFTVGALSSVAIVLIAMMRNRTDLALNLAFISFFLFFTYNVFRELSGFNDVTETHKLTQGEAAQIRVMKWPTFVAVVLSAIVLGYMAYKAKVPHPSGRGSLITEAVILGTLTAISEIVVAKNHGAHFDTVVITGLSNFVLFGGGHLLLQWGGFYNHIFSPSPPCIY